MGTPARQLSPFSVITDEAIYQYEELDSVTWTRLIQKALEALRPLKNVSGFHEFSERPMRQLGWSTSDVRPDEMVFSPGLGFNTLCAEIVPIFEIVSGDIKEEQKLFLLKSGGLALFSCSFVHSETLNCHWRAMKAYFSEVGADMSVGVLAAKTGNPSLFWARFFRSLCDLSALDRNLKKERAEDSQRAFDTIQGMRRRIFLPELS